MKMRHVQCQVNGCRSNGASKGIRFFRFPVKDKSRCLDWIVACGKEAILTELDDSKLQARYVCSVHFDTEDFMDPVSREKLMPGARPKAPLPASSEMLDETTTEADASPEGNWQESIASHHMHLEPSSTSAAVREEMSEQAARIGRQVIPPDKKQKNRPSPDVSKLRQLLRKKTDRIRYLEKRCAMLSKPSSSKKSRLQELVSLMGQHLTGDPLLMFCMQLTHKGGSPYTTDEKRMAKSFFHHGPELYRFLLERGFILPAESTIRKGVNE